MCDDRKVASRPLCWGSSFHIQNVYDDWTISKELGGIKFTVYSILKGGKAKTSLEQKIDFFCDSWTHIVKINGVFKNPWQIWVWKCP